MVYFTLLDPTVGYKLGFGLQIQMAALYFTETIPIAQTRTRIPIQIQISNCYCNHYWDVYLYPDWCPSPSPAM